MNPRDLPEIVAELIIEMHEVRSELRSIRDEQRGMRAEMQGIREEQRGMREEMRAMPDRIGSAVIKSLEPFLNRLLDHDDQLRSHESRLGKLENPSA